MKQILAVFLCILALWGANVYAYADNEFENAWELYEYWAEEADFPDYITGVWSSNGGHVNLTFGLTNDAAGRAGAVQILALVADDSTVTIAYQTYGLNYLYSIQTDVERYLQADLGFRSVGVYFQANRVEVEIAQSRLNDPATLSAVDTLTEQYGTAIYFTFTNTVTGPVGGVAQSPVNGLWRAGDPASPLLYGMFAACILAVAALLLLEYKRRKLLMFLTDMGAAAAPKARRSCHAVKTAVRNSASEPSPETQARIYQTIRQTEP